MLVTLYVPVRNMASTIGDALESLLAQTYAPTEIIVSDQGSTDGTREVVAGFADRGVRLVEVPAPLIGGACDNWCRAAQAGQGEYVGIYHADDVYDPDLVQVQAETLKASDDLVAVFPSLREFDQPRSTDPVQIVRQGYLEALRAMIAIGQYISSSGPMLRRSAFSGMVPDDRFGWAADTDLWLRLIQRGPMAMILQPAMLRYRRWEGQATYQVERESRHAVQPILPVLLHHAAQVLADLSADDLVRLWVRRHSEDARVAANLCADGKFREAMLRALGLCAHGA